jgi:hypothetical protein
MDVHLRELAARQYDVVAAWQLVEAGSTSRMVNHRVRERGWRRIHPGVYALTHAPLTRHQLWIAATLTAPGTVLSHASAAASVGFRPFKGRFETVTRPGSGGPRRHPGVLVFRSTTLDGNTTRHEGIAITTPARTLLDLAPELDAAATRRAFRELLRLKLATTEELLSTVARHPGMRGTLVLRQLGERCANLPYERTRSDAESLALEILHDAGVPPPRVNMRIAGEEADLAWPDWRRIIEIDGPQYHQFADEDARKQRRWESAGYVVRRISSDAVYDRPTALIELAPRPSGPRRAATGAPRPRSPRGRG